MSRSNNTTRFILALSCGILCGSSAAAQTVYTTVTGQAGNDRLGAAIASAGDLNADGNNEFIVGVPQDGNVFLAGTGFIRVYDGDTGSVYGTYPGSASDFSFGHSVSGGHDFDGLGKPDFVVGAPFTDGTFVSSGRVSVISSETGLEILEVFGGANGERLGRRVLAVADQNGDMTPDFVAASYSADGNKGIVRLFSGQSGALLQTWTGTGGSVRLGTSLAQISSINAPDVVPDIVVGSVYGGYYIFSGSSTTPLLHQTAASVGETSFGSSLATIPDLNGDSVEEVVAGAPQMSIFAPGTGRVYVRDGKTGAALYHVDGAMTGQGFGAIVSGAGDWDDDGTGDFAVTSKPMTSETFVTFHSGVIDGTSGSQIGGMLLGDSPTDSFGHAVTSLGDLQNDNKPEVLIGAPDGSVNFSRDGYARIFTSLGNVENSGVSDCDCTGGNSPCGNQGGADRGCPNSGDINGAMLVGAGHAAISIDSFTLSVSGAGPNKPGIVLAGNMSLGPFGAGTVPDSAGLLCVAGQTRRGFVALTDGTGAADFSDFQGGAYGASDIVGIGFTISYTHWFRDPGTANGCSNDTGSADFNFSNGWSVNWLP
jgi:hypothetical protein